MVGRVLELDGGSVLFRWRVGWVDWLFLDGWLVFRIIWLVGAFWWWVGWCFLDGGWVGWWVVFRWLVGAKQHSESERCVGWADQPKPKVFTWVAIIYWQFCSLKWQLWRVLPSSGVAQPLLAIFANKKPQTTWWHTVNKYIKANEDQTAFRVI